MLAEDASPNRLERAKFSISQLISNLHGDRIGLVVFAGNAFVQMPITNDYEATRLFLSTIDTRSATKQGTAVGNAINLCLESFDTRSKANKVIMVITDGENHEDDAVNAARIAAENHQVVVHTIGIGTVEGTLIPLYSAEGYKTGFRKDQDGTPVVTALNELALRDIASAGGGTFTRVVNNSTGLTDILKKIESLEKTELNKKQFSDYQHRFGWFLLPAILLLAMEQVLAARKGKWSSAINFIE
jgi:Ca-activated chloride channel family protein